MINWDDINLPSGITVDKLWEDILSIAKVKSRQHATINKFWLTKEDLEQEIIIKCIKALPKFNPEKSYNEKHILYFARCADNVVTDLKRKHLYYHKLPCKTCPHWMKDKKRRGEHDCGQFVSKDSCSLYVNYMKLYRAKFMLGTTYGNYTEYKPSVAEGDKPGEASGYMHSTSGTGLGQYVESMFDLIDLEEFMENKLSSEAFVYFKTLLRSNYNVSKLSPCELELLSFELSEIYDIDDNRKMSDGE